MEETDAASRGKNEIRRKAWAQVREVVHPESRFHGQ